MQAIGDVQADDLRKDLTRREAVKGKVESIRDAFSI
jgi:hypothetical protein